MLLLLLLQLLLGCAASSRVPLVALLPQEALEHIPMAAPLFPWERRLQASDTDIQQPQCSVVISYAAGLSGDSSPANSSLFLGGFSLTAHGQVRCLSKHPDHAS